ASAGSAALRPRGTAAATASAWNAPAQKDLVSRSVGRSCDGSLQQGDDGSGASRVESELVAADLVQRFTDLHLAPTLAGAAFQRVGPIGRQHVSDVLADHRHPATEQLVCRRVAEG